MNLILLVLMCLMIANPATRPADPLAGATIRIELPDGTGGKYRLVAVEQPPIVPQSVGSITTSFGSGMAPAALHVHALDIPGVKDDPTRYRFRWDFGDASDPKPLAGFNAAHVYDKPGVYAVKLTLTSPDGEDKTYSTSVTVTTDTRRNFYLSAAGDDRNAGDDPARAVKTWPRARMLMASGVRVQLRRGDSFDVADSTKLPVRDMVITHYGDAKLPPPVINFVGKLTSIPLIDPQNGQDVIVDGIAFDSFNKGNNDKNGMPDAFRAAGLRLTVRNCTFRNMGYAFNGNGFPKGLLVQRCDAPEPNSIRGYFAYVQGEDCVYLDNTVANSTREHVLRVSDATRVLVSGNRFTNLDQSKTDKYDSAKASCLIQKGSYAYVVGNILSDGPVAVGPLGDGDGLKHPESRFDAAVFENNRIDKTFFVVNHGSSRVRVTGNRIRCDGGSAISIHGYNKEFDRGTGDVQIDRNTMLNDNTQGRGVRTYSTPEKIELTNNVYLAPKLEPGSHGTAAIYVEASDLRAFTKIGGNVWPKGKPLAFARGGSVYVWPKWSDTNGYKPASEWAAMNPVEGDRFEDLPLDAKVTGTGADESALPSETK